MSHTYLSLDELERCLSYVAHYELPAMTDCLKGEEVIFAAAYTYHPIRVLRVPSGELHTLSNEEVELAAGSYDFEDASEVINRFIIWRSNRSSLLVEERSVEQSLEYASLCFSFSPANVIPGTGFFFADNKLVLIVPTQNTLHRFAFDLSVQKRKGNQDRAILTLAEDQSFLQNNDSYEIASSGYGCRASIIHSASNGTTAVYAMTDGQIVLVQMRHAVGDRGEGREKVIRGDGLLQRVMKAAHHLSLVVSIASCSVRDELLFYVLFDDRRLHVYTKGKKEYDANLYDMLVHSSDSEFSGERVSAEIVKICSNRNSFYVVVLFNVDDSCVFMVAKIDTYLIREHVGYFTLIGVFQTESGIVDFTCLLHENIMEIIGLCKIPDGLRYCLRVGSIDCWSGTLVKSWRQVNEVHSGDPDVSVLLAKPQQSIAAKKSYIFDANRYPYSVVLRSLQLVCKKAAFNWDFLEKRNDWHVLREAAEKYCSSPEFDRDYVTREDRSFLATVRPNEAGQERFWTALGKMCNELLQNECLSLALWHSKPLGLYGTIQQGRFTTCRPGDEQLRWFEHLIGSDQANVNKCWRIVSQFATEGLVASKVTEEDIRQFKSAFASVSHIFEDAIRKFTELRPVDEFVLKTTAEVPFDGPFTTGLLATSFERLIDDRLALSQCLISLMVLVKVIYSSDELAANTRWETTVSTHEKSLHDINRQFTVLSQAMKLRVSIDHYHETSLADGFFASTGLPTILSYTQSKDLLGDDDDMEEEEEDEEDDDDEIPENKVMAAEVGQAGQASSSRHQQPSQALYSQFINKIVTDAVIVLWPENTAMVLARFLADGHQYSALQAYCQLNEPYVTELCSAFRFFEAFAFAGLKEPEKALQSFLDAMDGIKRGDEALNRMLCPDGNVPDVPHTEVQYLLKVLSIMEFHGFNEQLVHLSRLALNEALRSSRRHARVLPELYMYVFKYELITERYEDALNTLLLCPVPENRRICLRELLTKLLEKRKNDAVVNLRYGNMEQQAIEILKAKARTSDVSKEGYYYELLYAFHIKRDCCQRAALVMLDYSCRLQLELQNRDVLSRRCRALSTAANLLSLLPEIDQFLALPAATTEKHKNSTEEIETTEVLEAKKKNERKLGKNALVIWTLADISKRAVLSSARLALFDANYNFKEKKSIPPPIKLEEIFEQLIEKKLFDLAWEVSKVFDLKPYPLLKAVTQQCIYEDAAPSKGEPRWVVKNRKFLRTIPNLRERHWAILRGYLEVAIRRSPEDSKILWEVTYVFLQHQWHIPPWLTRCYEGRRADEYAHLLIMFDHLHLAYESLKRKVILETKKITSRHSRTSIPATEIDWLLWLISKRNDPTLQEEADHLKDYVQRYLDRIASFSER